MKLEIGKTTCHDCRKAIKINESFGHSGGNFYHSICPKRLSNKLKGQRLGQALWNALYAHKKRYSDDVDHWDIAYALFYTPDEELRKLLNDYLREL